MGYQVFMASRTMTRTNYQPNEHADILKLIINNLAVGMPLQHLCLSYFHESFIAKSCQYASSASLPSSWFSHRSFPAMPPSALISSR
jgi:hypothetical protein